MYVTVYIVLMIKLIANTTEICKFYCELDTVLQ